MVLMRGICAPCSSIVWLKNRAKASRSKSPFFDFPFFSSPPDDCASDFGRTTSTIGEVVLSSFLFFTLLCGVVSAITWVFAAKTPVSSAKTSFSVVLTLFSGVDTSGAVRLSGTNRMFFSMSSTFLRLASSHRTCMLADVSIRNELKTPSSKRERLTNPFTISEILDETPKAPIRFANYRHSSEPHGIAYPCE